MNAAYNQLLAYETETIALSKVAERLGWDQETMMPAGAAHERAEEIAAIEGVLHARRTNPQVGDWLAQAENKVPSTNEVQVAQLRHIRRSYERMIKVPAALAQELARTTSLGHSIWAKAKADNDIAAFLPVLKKIVALRQEEGAALAQGEEGAYDALIHDYEPGTNAQEIEALFTKMRPRLVALCQRILAADTPRIPALNGSFPKDAQLDFARQLAGTFGYDWNRGRMDLAVHPFCAGKGSDVRITTRVALTDPFNCFYSTIHETGHACYEQNINPDYALTHLGGGVSMGVHESQSRIYENQLGRSQAFTAWMFKEMTARFGDFGPPDAHSFYRLVNQVRPGPIRTEADEVYYNLHVMLRFDLERALIQKKLDVTDLEEAWNTRFEADFGTKVASPAQGMLQDVHWSAGMFGYFPTYTLGNIYAACLHQALRADVPDLDDSLLKGDIQPATVWLREKLQRHGGLYEPREVITRACGGKEPTEEPLLSYLEAKFSNLYNL